MEQDLEDDWFALDWTDLEIVLKYFWVTPPEVTVTGIRSLVETLAAASIQGPRSMSLTELERILQTHELDGMSLMSLDELLTAIERSAVAAEGTVFEALPVSALTRAFSRRFGRVELVDVVELAALASTVGGQMDVLSPLQISDVIGRLAPPTCRAMSLKDLRAVLERLAALPAPEARS